MLKCCDNRISKSHLQVVAAEFRWACSFSWSHPGWLGTSLLPVLLRILLVDARSQPEEIFDEEIRASTASVHSKFRTHTNAQAWVSPKKWADRATLLKMAILRTHLSSAHCAVSEVSECYLPSAPQSRWDEAGSWSPVLLHSLTLVRMSCILYLKECSEQERRTSTRS
jgi:hypothetical protein